MKPSFCAAIRPTDDFYSWKAQWGCLSVRETARSCWQSASAESAWCFSGAKINPYDWHCSYVKGNNLFLFFGGWSAVIISCLGVPLTYRGKLDTFQFIFHARYCESCSSLKCEQLKLPLIFNHAHLACLLTASLCWARKQKLTFVLGSFSNTHLISALHCVCTLSGWALRLMHLFNELWACFAFPLATR